MATLDNLRLAYVSSPKLYLKTNPKYESKMKLFCGDNFRQKYSTTFKIVLLVRSGVPT